MRKLFENWRYNLTEARIDKVKSKYSGNDELIEKLSNGDPSGNDKYLSWMAKQVINNNHDPDKVVSVTQKFHKVRQRLQGAEKDIYQWDFSDLRDKVQSMGKSKTKKAKETKEDVVKIYEDDKYLFIAPLTKETSCIYGQDTKWCISGKDDNSFTEYAHKEKVNIVMLIDKDKNPRKDPSAKFGLIYYPEEKMQKIAPFVEMDIDDITKDPQEVFNAKDDLVCALQFPDDISADIQQHPEAWRTYQQYKSSKLGACRQKLDQITNGLWSKKYRNIVASKLGKIREKLDDIMVEEYREIMPALKIIGKWMGSSQFESEDAYEFKRISWKEGLGAMEMEIKTHKTELDLAAPQITGVLKLDLRKMGLKPVEYSLKELLFLDQLKHGVKPEDLEKKVKDAIEPLSKISKKDYETIVSSLSKYSKKQNITGRLQKVVRKSVLESVKEMVDVLEYTKIDYMSVRVNYVGPEERKEEKMEIIFVLDPRMMGNEYIKLLMACMEIDKNFVDFIKKIRSKILDPNFGTAVAGHNLNTDDRMFSRLPGDRKHYFLEPA